MIRCKFCNKIIPHYTLSHTCSFKLLDLEIENEKKYRRKMADVKRIKKREKENERKSIK